MSAPWVSLFSGGKDSTWALHRALATGRPVETLLTVHPPPGSFLFHVPATRLAGLAAQSIGLGMLEVDPDLAVDDASDSGEAADRELEPVEAALDAFRREHDGLGGITAGAVASEYQRGRLAAMAERLGCELFAPLWGVDPLDAGHEMVDAGFDIRIVRVAAAGLDETWLGRRLDHDALDELADLHARHGVHVLGEGGEYETLVVDGPHLSRRIAFEAVPTWDGVRGDLRIESAWLEPG